jgi:hypothetical protein
LAVPLLTGAADERPRRQVRLQGDDHPGGTGLGVGIPLELLRHQYRHYVHHVRSHLRDGSGSHVHHRGGLHRLLVRQTKEPRRGSRRSGHRNRYFRLRTLHHVAPPGVRLEVDGGAPERHPPQHVRVWDSDARPRLDHRAEQAEFEAVEQNQLALKYLRPRPEDGLGGDQRLAEERKRRRVCPPHVANVRRKGGTEQRTPPIRPQLAHVRQTERKSKLSRTKASTYKA